MTPTGAAIEARDLTKTYKDVRALDRLGFSVEAGTVFGLLGRDGARQGRPRSSALATLSLPDSGQARVAGVDVLAEARPGAPGHRPGRPALRGRPGGHRAGEPDPPGPGARPAPVPQRGLGSASCWSGFGLAEAAEPGRPRLLGRACRRGASTSPWG